MRNKSANVAAPGRTGKQFRVLWLVAFSVCLALWSSGEANAESTPGSPAPGAPTAPTSVTTSGTGGTSGRDEARFAIAASFAATEVLVRDLLAGRLSSQTAAASLFDVDIRNPAAVDVERQRLSRLLEERGAAPSAPESHPSKPARVLANGRGESKGDGGEAGAEDPPLAISNEVEARLALDRARLAFYRLAGSQREQLLLAHQSRQEELAQTPEAQLDEAERRVRAAEQERLAALESARTARSEALRLVSEEHARLLQVAQHQAEVEKTLVRAQSELRRREEGVLRWHRKVREATQAGLEGNDTSVDAMYQQLRTELRAARDLLAVSLASVAAEGSVPGPGDDRLSSLPEDVPAAAPRATRKAVEVERDRLVALEAALKNDTSRVLYEEIVSLNHDRLALYPFLTSARRDLIVGFGPQGLDQARAEGRQVLLVLRRHLQATGQFIASLAAPGEARSDSALTATLIALKWLLPCALFIVWRRRAADTLTTWRDAVREERRNHRVVVPSPIERALGFLLRVRSPVEWLLLLASVVWLLPAAAKNTLEVSLLSSVFAWTLGGAAVVDAIDAWAAGNEGGSRESRLITAHVRFRSLRLIGRVVVAVALVLSVSDQLVGRGTLYSWVLSTCWFAAIPIVLIMAHWWHDIIHERLSLRRRKSLVDAWVLKHGEGWRRLPAALVGGVLLLGRGSYRWLRQRLVTFDLSRRILAYLFNRDMNRRTTAGIKYQNLPRETFEALGPETQSENNVSSIADGQMKRVVERISAAGGGLIAIVGGRGAGKSTLLRSVLREVPDTRLIECPLGDVREFARALAQAVGAREGASLEEVAAALDHPHRNAGLLIDDASRLIMPRMGGLDVFDELLSTARRRSSHCAWVFAFDEVVWRFFERARGARPLFDEVIRLEPWHEEGIGRLLINRTKAVGLAPSFRHLLTDLPEDADDIDINEATERTAAGYYRLVWDYAGGNPGIALHAWRLCLGVAPDGQVLIKGFDAPNTLLLEGLPDSSVFVLRAVVQLGLAHPEDILQATMLEPSEIQDALRFGLNHGYLKLIGVRYWVTWAWFQPIIRFLQRRYLLSSH